MKRDLDALYSELNYIEAEIDEKNDELMDLMGDRRALQKRIDKLEGFDEGTTDTGV